MLNNLPVAYRRDRWVIDLLNAIRILDEKQRADAEDTAAQVLLHSMTWRLPAEEIEAGLTVSPSTPIEERRSALSAKWRSGAGRVGLEMIKQVCESWDGVKAEVGYDGLGTLSVVANRKNNTTDCTILMLKALRNTVPAHLGFELSIRRPEMVSSLSIGGRAAAIVKMPIPALRQEYKFAGGVMAGTRIASVSVIPIPCLN